MHYVVRIKKGKEMSTINIPIVATIEKRRREVVTETAPWKGSEVAGKIFLLTLVVAIRDFTFIIY